MGSFDIGPEKGADVPFLSLKLSWLTWKLPPQAFSKKVDAEARMTWWTFHSKPSHLTVKSANFEDCRNLKHQFQLELGMEGGYLSTHPSAFRNTRVMAEGHQ